MRNSIRALKIAQGNTTGEEQARRQTKAQLQTILAWLIILHFTTTRALVGFSTYGKALNVFFYI